MDVQDSPIDKSMREKLCLDLEGGKFEKILSKLIVDHLPKSYLENYKNLHSKGFTTYFKNPQLIVGSESLYFNEAFKLWATYCVEQGTKLVVIQHGGGYGSYYWLATERHELKICDYFFSWGWYRQTQSAKILPLPTPKLTLAKMHCQPDAQGKILIVLNS